MEMVLGNGKSGQNNRPENNQPDDSQPDGVDSDADSWVAQWSNLFEDDPEPKPSGQPPTREMPVFQANQPPIGGNEDTEFPGMEFPGHRSPKPPGQPKPRQIEGDAAEIEAWQKSQERTKRRAKLRANQRKARDIQRQQPDSSTISMADLAADSTTGSGLDRRAAILGGGLLLIAALAVTGYLFTGLGSGSSATDDAGSSIGIVPAARDDLSLRAPLDSNGVEDLALSTVQLLGIDDDGDPQCAGSGVIVESDGTILTNAHVVTSSADCEFSTIGVAVTVDSSSPAVLQYRADVIAVDPILDLAVLRIVDFLGSNSGDLLPTSFLAAPLGDSDTVGLGDDLRILGYPVIGGETITFTTGSVSGFSAQEGLGPRALIKTDASISAGNSGGMAVDSSGQVVGIPTKARASESGPAIDCRPISDTNADGEIDADDNCVPVGGFLNGVRPINLATDLLAQALDGESIGAVVRSEISPLSFDLESVSMTNPRFSLGRIGNSAGDEIVTATAGINQLCFFVDWEGIPQGVRWAGAWFLDGDLQDGFGSTDETWTLPNSGTEFSLCAEEDDAAGLAAGVYQVAFFIEDVLIFAEGIEVTEEPVEIVEATWLNSTEVELCALAVNPYSESRPVGLNELEAGETIPPEASYTMELPLGLVVVEAYDCDGEPVADNLDGLPITGSATPFSIGLP